MIEIEPCITSVNNLTECQALIRGEHDLDWAGPTPDPETNAHSVGLQFLGSRTNAFELGIED